jgi:hypothetical protein
MFFVLLGLTVLYQEPSIGEFIKLPIASCILAFAFLTRANGILNIGYIGYPLMMKVVTWKDADGRLQLEESVWKVAEKV